ncbi:MAG TPA: nucleoside monophosphate kinase [Patescibacteria group bacterium]|nr:nucleoside monophosphate kinase [Patescibacteria group bacterium]
MIILMGIVGAGKGTQAQMLADHSGFKAISTGDLLRKYATEEQHRRMLAGELLDDDEIIEMVDKVLTNEEDPAKCLLDGFPRSVKQTKWLMEQIRLGRFKLTEILHLIVSEDIVRKRMLARGRPDDTEETIAKRFQEYHSITEPILEYMEQQKIKVVDIDGDQEPEAVHRDVVRAIEQALER